MQTIASGGGIEREVEVEGACSIGGISLKRKLTVTTVTECLAARLDKTCSLLVQALNVLNGL